MLGPILKSITLTGLLVGCNFSSKTVKTKRYVQSEQEKKDVLSENIYVILSIADLDLSDSEKLELSKRLNSYEDSKKYIVSCMDIRLNLIKQKKQENYDALSVLKGKIEKLGGMEALPEDERTLIREQVMAVYSETIQLNKAYAEGSARKKFILDWQPRKYMFEFSENYGEMPWI